MTRAGMNTNNIVISVGIFSDSIAMNFFSVNNVKINIEEVHC